MAIPKQNVCSHEIDQRIPVIVEDALLWPTMGGTYFKVLGCLGAALVDLLGGEVGFNSVDVFKRFLETELPLALVKERELPLVLMNVKGLGGGGGRGIERTNGFKQVLPSDVNT